MSAGFRITAEVLTPVVASCGDGRVHLDSVLAYAQIMGRESEFPPVASNPVPIQIDGLHEVARSADGWPLWACTDLYPRDPFQSREYAHRRFASHRAEFGHKPGVSTVATRYKEQRRSMRLTHADRWVAVGIGDPAAVRELLGRVRHIGGRTGAGYGRVGAWSVSPCDVDLVDVLARRCVPVEFKHLADGRPVQPLLGWTPPYWHASLWRPGREAQPCF